VRKLRQFVAAPVKARADLVDSSSLRKSDRAFTGTATLVAAWFFLILGTGALADDQHWAFKAPQRSAVPNVRNEKWIHNSIDAFIAVQHEHHALEPSVAASRQTFIRRLSIDLTGLPPSPEEAAAFVSDHSSDAYERLVERLLSSPHYGERWGRHWLDLARWAETDGYEANDLRTSAWRYRDYVVRSFSEDKPYDRFLREQIAGDEIVPYSDENLIATGFLAAGRINNNEEDKAVQRNEALVDVANATASVTLGLTLGCAQCHDHKFDPLTARDYYRFQGFFLKGQVNSLLLKDTGLWQAYEASIPPELEIAKNLRKALYDPVRLRLMEEAKAKLAPEILAAINTPLEKRNLEQRELAKNAEKELVIPKDKIEKAMSEDDQKLFKELEKKISNTEKQLNERKPQTWAFYSPATSPHPVQTLPGRGMYPLPYEPQKLREAKPRLLKRGDVHRPESELDVGWPAILGPIPGSSDKASRLTLVEWLTSSANPLVARVWVNFIWQQHFGRGIVATSGDFGTQGARPTHPELLDWLATELMRSGWSTKHIHRLIALSSTYRQAAQPNSANSSIDPGNLYLWRWPLRRLEAESIRDSLLAVSGELDRHLGGPSISPEKEEASLRRSIYLRQKRHEFPVMQTLFDSPIGNESCPRRHVSTVSLQPLYMMNSRFVLKRAEAFAARVLAHAGHDQPRQIEAAFLMALGRPPEQADLEMARAFLDGNETAAASNRSGTARAPEEKELRPGLLHFCHALLNLSEFIYLP
jgi:hypothetical protein